jgi:hypothetical protein
VSIGVGSLVRSPGFYIDTTIPARNPLEVGLVLELDRRAMGRPVWTVLWPDGSIYAEYDRDLSVIEQEAP